MEQGKSEAGRNPVIEYFAAFSVLKECPKRFWGVQAVNFLENTSYFSLMIVITTFLSGVCGFSDASAGYTYTMLGIVTSIALLAVGSITDWLGIRKALYIGTVIKIVCMGLVTWIAFSGKEFDGREIVIMLLFAGMGIQLALYQAVYQIGNRKFATEKAQSAAFNIWYLFMNLGGLLAGVVVNVVTVSLGLSETYIVLLSVILSVFCLFAVFFMIDTDDDVEGEKGKEGVKAEKPKPWMILWDVVTKRVFWKLVLLVTLFMGTRAVFIYFHALMPKYWKRVIGPDAAVGLLESINPALIVLGLILFIPIASKMNVYKTLTWGAIVSGASLFAFVIPWQVFPGGFVAAYYTMAVLCMIVLSVGEVFWSPRLQQYIAAVAPKGQEGTYLGISMITWFGTKTVVGVLSGHMLKRWVPEFPEGTPILGERIMNGEVAFWDRPEAMWLILGVFAVIGPIIAIVFSKFFLKGAQFDKTK